jgi:hypothetical protein
MHNNCASKLALYHDSSISDEICENEMSRVKCRQQLQYIHAYNSRFAGHVPAGFS